MPRILCIDNYDSFVFTIVGYLRQLGAQVEVVRNDAVPGWSPLLDCSLSSQLVTATELGAGASLVKDQGQVSGLGMMTPGQSLEDSQSWETFFEYIKAFEGVLISPGPGNPDSAGSSLAVIAAAVGMGKPVLGVCLGHQGLGQIFGAHVVHAPTLMHGKTSTVTHNGQGVFSGLPNPLVVTRYHSLTLDPDTVSHPLQIDATSEDGVVQAVSYPSAHLYGVQFHPEAILTQSGEQLLNNWLNICCEVSANNL